MESKNPEAFIRIQQYMAAINPHISEIQAVEVQDFRVLMFKGRNIAPLPAENVSDGTLRALAILVAAFQPQVNGKPAIIGLEEPESGLHPAASSVLFDALLEASATRQIIVTTHSADLLDRSDLQPDMIRAVSIEDGETIIGPVDEPGVKAIRERLYTPGELMRMNQLQPMPFSRQST
jgi:predicted ATPase